MKLQLITTLITKPTPQSRITSQLTMIKKHKKDNEVRDYQNDTYNQEEHVVDNQAITAKASDV